MTGKQPKRKATLASRDANANALVAPPANKRSKIAQASSSRAAAAAKKYIYSDPSLVANIQPVDIEYIGWPESSDDDDDEDSDEEDEEEEEVAPGSLQDILNKLEDERSKAADDALNPPHERAMGVPCMSFEEGRRRIDEASKPYLEKMDEARRKFVTEGLMTEEEVKAVVVIDAEERKSKPRAKKALLKLLNKVQKERNKAIHLALHSDGVAMTSEEEQEKIAMVSKPFEEQMNKIRKAFQVSYRLTVEETEAIVPTVEDEFKEGVERSKKDGEKESFVPRRTVTDKGFPITKAGMEKFLEINEEVDKRNQDNYDMYIYNDFSGYGVTEVLENVLAEFNKIAFKKDVSPLKKWALVEGLTTYLALGDHMALMMNDNSDGISEVFDMMGVMFITGLEILDECGLIGPAPLPDNIGLMTLFFLNFMSSDASDFELDWVYEIVRIADTCGVELNPIEQIENIDQETLDGWRDMYAEEKKDGFTWKAMYPKFKRNHPGGHKFDITRWSKKEKAEYKLG